MSKLYEDDQLAAKVAELEKIVEKQDKKIRVLGVLMSVNNSLLGDPIKGFFDAPEFWELIYEDWGACHNRCHEMPSKDGRYKCHTTDCLDLHGVRLPSG